MGEALRSIWRSLAELPVLLLKFHERVFQYFSKKFSKLQLKASKDWGRNFLVYLEQACTTCGRSFPDHLKEAFMSFGKKLSRYSDESFQELLREVFQSFSKKLSKCSFWKKLCRVPWKWFSPVIDFFIFYILHQSIQSKHSRSSEKNLIFFWKKSCTASGRSIRKYLEALRETFKNSEFSSNQLSTPSILLSNIW